MKRTDRENASTSSESLGSFDISRRGLLRAGVGLGALGAASSFAPIVLASNGTYKVPIAQTTNSLFYLPMYTALDNGLFKKEGVELDLINAGGSAEAVNAVVSRQAACSTQDPVRCEGARQKGAPTTIIGSSINRFAAYIIGKNEIPPQDLNAWKGKHIAAVQRPNSAHSAIDFVLLKGGWKQTEPNVWRAPDGGEPLLVTEVKQGNEFQPLLAGIVDMSVGYEPSASDAVARGKDLHFIWSFPEAFGEFLFGGWCAYTEDVEKRPDMLQAYMNGIAHAYKFLYENPDKALESAYKWFPKLKKEAIQSAFNRFLKENVYPTKTTVTQAAFEANFNQFVPFVKYPINPVTMAEATHLEFAEKADAKFGLK